MADRPYRIGLLSDFNVQNLAVLLEKSSAQRRVECAQAPFGQTMQLLLDEGHEFWIEPSDAIVVWTLPEFVSPEFQKALAFEGFSQQALLAEVDAFCGLLKRIPATARTLLLPTWTAFGLDRGLGPLNSSNKGGIANALMRMNLRVADHFENDPRVILLDAQAWIGSVGKAAYNSKLWYLAKTPFQNEVFHEASLDMLSVIDANLGRSRKVLILDLDNTLWGGIVGEIGWEKLRVGGHDAIGEAFRDFQRKLKRLANRGVLLAIASKNEEEVAMEALRRHPEMVLRPEDFVAWKIDWRDKAQNIADIMAGLNLGLDSAVFFDDNPAERSRVKEAISQVLVPDFPVDPLKLPSFVSGLRCFDSLAISQEDRARGKMYVADRERKALQESVGSIKDWLPLLNLRVAVEPLSEANLERASQLFNKTNQMNLSSRRLSASGLLSWSKANGDSLWTYRVSDKFGDYGLCGISSLAREGSKAKLVDFLLSCRVMGRGVEETMLAAVIRQAKTKACSEFVAEYIPTPKNQPCEKWFQSQTVLSRQNNCFQLSPLKEIEFPKHVNVSLGT